MSEIAPAPSAAPGIDLALAQRLKLWLAVIMLLCFCLPLAQCTQKAGFDAQGKLSTVETAEDYVPVLAITWSDPKDWLLLADYLWPWLTALCGWRWRRRAARITINVVEVLLCLAAAAHIGMIIHVWGHIRYGGVLLLAAFAAYAGIAGALAWFHFRHKVDVQP